MLAQTLEPVHRRGPEEKRYSLVRVQAHANSLGRIGARSRLEQLTNERAVPLHRDDAVGLLLDVRTAAPPHLVELETTVGGLPNGAREQVGPRRGNHDATADLPDEARSLALVLGGDDHRAARGEDPVQATRYDIPCEPLCETDDVNVGARERQRESLALLVREEANRLLDLEARRESEHLGVAGSEPGDHDLDVSTVSEERRRADEAVEVLCVPDVAGVHDDEA